MKKLITAIAFMFPVLLFAQESDLGNWLIYIGNKKINNNWNWHHEAQYRNYNAIGDLEQLLLRTGIGYNLTPGNNNLLLGYAYILSENYTSPTGPKVSISESRIYQQFVTKQNAYKVKLQHRYRFEQRWIGEDNDFRMRFRYFLSARLPLNKPTLERDTWYLSGYNEIFINNEARLFDRNRLYGGLGYQLNKSLKFEVGYMNQFLGDSARDQVNLFVLASF